MNDFNEPGTLAPTGLYLGGTKYMVIQGEPGAVIRGKKVGTNIWSCLDFVHYATKSMFVHFLWFTKLSWISTFKLPSCSKLHHHKEQSSGEHFLPSSLVFFWILQFLIETLSSCLIHLASLLISGPWWCYHQEDQCGLNHWNLWWADDPWAVQHDCWKAWWLSHWSGSLGGLHVR